MKSIPLKRNLTEIAARTYDLLVVGGGIFGACAAWEAAASGLSVAGWVFNQIDPDMQQVAAVKQTLQSRMPGRLIADIPWQSSPAAREISLQLDKLDVKRKT